MLQLAVCDDEKVFRSDLRKILGTELELCGIDYHISEFISQESPKHVSHKINLTWPIKKFLHYLYDKNLISEQFQAWVHGAVQPALYQKYKAYGYDEIPQVTNTDDIPEEFLSFAHDVYESYGHLSGYDLECLNHQEDPWINARGACRPWERCTNEISEEDMKNYYRKMIK